MSSSRARPWSRGCVGRLALPEPPDALVIVDLGAGTGGNSMAALGEAVAAARGRRGDLPIVCVHSDLPTNDWNGLFSALSSSPNSYLRAEGPPALPMAAGRSFFEPVVPRGLAHLEVSFSAAHWLRAQPSVAIPAGFYFCEATGLARDAIAAQAAADWEAFLRARAADLAAGGAARPVRRHRGRSRRGRARHGARAPRGDDRGGPRDGR